MGRGAWGVGQGAWGKRHGAWSKERRALSMEHDEAMHGALGKVCALPLAPCPLPPAKYFPF